MPKSTDVLFKFMSDAVQAYAHGNNNHVALISDGTNVIISVKGNLPSTICCMGTSMVAWGEALATHSPTDFKLCTVALMAHFIAIAQMVEEEKNLPGFRKGTEKLLKTMIKEAKWELFYEDAKEISERFKEKEKRNEG